MTNAELMAAVRTWAAANYPGCPFEYITIHCRYLPVPIQLAEGPEGPEASSSPIGDDDAWEPTEYQCRILEALEYKALRSEALWAAVGGDRARIWKKNGVKELIARGLVVLDASPRRLGYYRPDAPPEELGET